MSEIYLFYGIFTFCAWGIASLIFEYSNPSKFLKRHLKTRKKILFFFALFSLALFWIQLENAVEISTLANIWMGNIILFIGYTGWSIKNIYQDYRRIKSIESRRKQEK